MMDNNIGKRNQLLVSKFEDLPPRVIIHGILTCHVCGVYPILEMGYTEKDCRELRVQLFGYFKKDRTRNLWFVFPSISCGGEYLKAIHVNVSKIFHIEILCMGNGLPFIRDCLSKLSSDMLFLQSLEVQIKKHILYPIETFSLESIENILIEKSKFPNLKSFSIKRINTVEQPFGKSWSENDCSFFNKITNLCIQNGGEEKYFRNDLFFSNNPEKFKNLTKLDLKQVMLEKEMEVEIPNLRSLSFYDVQNLVIIPKNQLLLDVKLEECENNLPQQLVHHLLKNSPKLRSLCLHRVFCQILFFQPDFPFIKSRTLKKLDFRVGFFYLSKMEIIYLSEFLLFNGQLSELKIEQETFEKENLDVLDETDFPSLKVLHVDTNPKVMDSSDLIWPCSLILKHLILEKIENDRLFENNKFPLLETLDITGLNSNLKGENWKSYEFPNLHTLKLSYLKSFTDNFFQQFKGSRLRTIVMYWVGSGINEFLVQGITDILDKDEDEDFDPLGLLMKGNGWSLDIFKNLEELYCSYCTRLTDSLFKENEFLELKVLDIKDCNRVDGKDWLEMKKIESKRVNPFFFGFGFGLYWPLSQ